MNIKCWAWLLQSLVSAILGVLMFRQRLMLRVSPQQLFDATHVNNDAEYSDACCCQLCGCEC